ncbi:MAG: DUF167 family protein [Thermoanaerobaculia bacterium]
MYSERSDVRRDGDRHRRLVSALAALREHDDSRSVAVTSLPWSLRGDHLILTVRLTPKAARDEISGVGHLSDERAVLQVRVRALPQDGAANEALVKVLAKALHLPTTSVRLESGATGRVKCLRLIGDPRTIEEALGKAARLA